MRAAYPRGQGSMLPAMREFGMEQKTVTSPVPVVFLRIEDYQTLVPSHLREQIILF